MFGIFKSNKKDLRKKLSEINFEYCLQPPNTKEVKEMQSLINTHVDFYNRGFKESSINVLNIVKDRLETYISKLQESKNKDIYDIRFGLTREVTTKNIHVKKQTNTSTSDFKPPKPATNQQ